MTDPNRGTGRTTKALLALPDNGVFVVRHSHHIAYCRRLLAANARNQECISFVPIIDAEKFLRGRGAKVAIDHACYDPPITAGLSEAIDWLHSGIVEFAQ